MSRVNIKFHATTDANEFSVKKKTDMRRQIVYITPGIFEHFQRFINIINIVYTLRQLVLLVIGFALLSGRYLVIVSLLFEVRG